MRTTVRVEGLREVEAALRELPKATAAGVARRVLKKRGEPIAAMARSLVRVDEGDLRDSITVGTKLSRRQASLNRRSGDRGDVEMFVGPGALPQAVTEEFGTIHQAPHPFMRPAWDASKRGVLEGLKDDLWKEIEKTAKRRAARAARAALPG